MESQGYKIPKHVRRKNLRNLGKLVGLRPEEIDVLVKLEYESPVILEDGPTLICPDRLKINDVTKI